jgi:hypothetical protein
MRARFVSIIFCVFALAFPALAAQNRRVAPSLDRVLPQIRHAMPGTFYDAEGPFLTPDGQATYRIKWMTPDGRIVWFSVDARSGQVLGGAPVTAPGRYRGDEDDRGWPRARDDDWDRSPRYGSRDEPWARDPPMSRERDMGGFGNDRRYDRGPDRTPPRSMDRGRSNDQSHDRGFGRAPDRSGGRGPDRATDHGRDKPRDR